MWHLSYLMELICLFFTLAVYCKDSLCRKETFVQLTELLTKDEAPLTQKRVSVYLLSVLVANNSKIQISLLYIKSAICADIKLFFMILCIKIYFVLNVINGDVHLLHSLPSVDSLSRFFVHRVGTDVGTNLWLSGCFIGTFQVLDCPFSFEERLARVHVEFSQCVNLCFLVLQDFFSSVHRRCYGEI